jgi:hypothetical protein
MTSVHVHVHVLILIALRLGRLLFGLFTAVVDSKGILSHRDFEALERD